MIEHELFTRSELNPIINPSDLPYPCDCVCNPAAHLVNGEVLLLLRVIDQEGSSHITVARSKDGLTNWRIEPKPLLHPSDQNLPFEAYGCEDPRLVYLAERGQYAITYTGYSPLGAGVCLATTTDFETTERYGLVMTPNNKDAALFPRKIGGKYWMLHRPALGDMEHIWLAESEDLVHWGRPWMIIEERGGPWWDGDKVGGGPPPIETPDGWLIIFHGVKSTSHGPIYRVGLALLDLENPHHVIRRIPRWVFGPKEPYESTGFIPGVVFPTGTIVKGDDLMLYYGAADTRIAVATTKIQTLLDALKDEGK
jgi:beta-1,4-mannooligosaccharide/beta-1,4-mannosyl-N-acetylglucosamine phosphorylase